MNSIRICFFCLFFICVTMIASALGNREKDNEAKPKMQTGEIIQVTGLVRLVGNANFPDLVIADSEKSWYVPREEMNKLFDYQQRAVTVEGEEIIIELTLANGRSAGMRRELRNIRILEIH